MTNAAPLLTLESVVPYLLEERLLDPAAAVDGPLDVLDYSRRNRNFKVVTADGGLLVKQTGDTVSAEESDGLVVEARTLRAVSTLRELRPLRWFSPRFVHYDASRRVLAVEAIHPSTTLSKYHLNLGDVRFPEDSATTAARILANFHAIGARAARQGLLPFLDASPPHAFDIPRNLGRLADQGARRAADLLALVQENNLWADVGRLRKTWAQGDALVHRDARWDNFLLTHGSGPSDNLNLRLIDWETVARGDGAWDVAQYLAEHLRFWLAYGSTPGAGTLESARATARWGPDRFGPAPAAFLLAYARRSGLGSRGERSLRRRVEAYLPLALAGIAFEALQGNERMPWTSRTAFAMAARAQEDASGFLREWLGIEPGA